MPEASSIVSCESKSIKPRKVSLSLLAQGKTWHPVMEAKALRAVRPVRPGRSRGSPGPAVDPQPLRASVSTSLNGEGQ